MHFIPTLQQALTLSISKASHGLTKGFAIFNNLRSISNCQQSRNILQKKERKICLAQLPAIMHQKLSQSGSYFFTTCRAFTWSKISVTSLFYFTNHFQRPLHSLLSIKRSRQTRPPFSNPDMQHTLRTQSNSAKNSSLPFVQTQNTKN